MREFLLASRVMALQKSTSEKGQAGLPENKPLLLIIPKARSLGAQRTSQASPSKGTKGGAKESNLFDSRSSKSSNSPYWKGSFHHPPTPEPPRWLALLCPYLSQNPGSQN